MIDAPDHKEYWEIMKGKRLRESRSKHFDEENRYGGYGTIINDDEKEAKG